MPSKRKQQGQYMSPPPIVTMILNSVGYNNTSSILSKTIMEPSFGNGAFLLEIARRIISTGKEVGLANEEIVQILQNNVHGIEKDAQLYAEAINNLNSLLQENGFEAIEWPNLHNGDTLLMYEDYIGHFDFVVGNPPFVKIHNIPLEYREITKEFQFANGVIDLYVIFYEIGLKMLKDEGKLGFITPNSFIRNASQKNFRKFLIKNHYIEAIYNFKDSRIFEDADTYTCICILYKSQQPNLCNMTYREYNMYNLVNETTIDYLHFDENGKAWELGSADDTRFLIENRNLSVKLGDIAVVQNGIVTNRDNLYIKKVFTDGLCSIPYTGKHTDEMSFVYFKHGNASILIESTILHRCVKASKFNGIMDNTYIIFPYHQVDSQCVPYTEKEMEEYFPFAYLYLRAVKGELDKRNMDKGLDWFLFGRSQGLQNIFKKKLVFKNIISKDGPCITPYILDEDVVIYSKLYITEKEGGVSLKEICKVIGSEEFWKYCTLKGKDMQGNYVDLSSASLIKGFGVNN